MLGYSEEESTYISVKEAQETIEEVDKERKSKLESSRQTRSSKPLPTRFKEDLQQKLKERYKGIKGLDGDVEEKPSIEEPRC